MAALLRGGEGQEVSLAISAFRSAKEGENLLFGEFCRVRGRGVLPSGPISMTAWKSSIT